jgi:hypothetical protein
MFCTECGAEINNNAVICPMCGVPVAGRGAAPAAPQANYAPPQANYAAPRANYAAPVNNVVVPNHMVGAILTTLFCCLIGGIIAIVYASQVNTKLAQGDIAGAQAASRTANGWIIANVIFGLIIPVFYAILFAASAAEM